MKNSNLRQHLQRPYGTAPSSDVNGATDTYTYEYRQKLARLLVVELDRHRVQARGLQAMKNESQKICRGK